MPQAASNGQASPKIVVRTVHGDVISVRMDLLGHAGNAQLSSELPKTESPQALRSAHKAG